MIDKPKGTYLIKASELPYLGRVPDDGRSIVLTPYYDLNEGTFSVFTWQPEGVILVLHRGILVEGAYLARSPADGLDCRLLLSETVIQHFSFKNVLHALRDAEKDLINGLASLHKYFVLLQYASSNSDLSHSLMVGTEMEYAFANHRSFYDCLHRVICDIRRQLQPKLPALPDSFARIGSKRDPELETKYQLSRVLIDFYRAREDVFSRLRDIRDNVLHRGASPNIVYRFPDGFAVGIDDQFSRSLGHLNLWPEDLLKPNRLGSVLALFRVSCQRYV